MLEGRERGEADRLEVRKEESAEVPSDQDRMVSLRLNVILPVFTVSVGSRYRVVSAGPSRRGLERKEMVVTRWSCMEEGVWLLRSSSIM